MLQPQYCSLRQKRLLDVLAAERLDAIVIGLPHHVYYFTGHWTHWTHHSAFILFADGRSWLATANQPAKGATAGQVVAYEANWQGTQRQAQPAAVAELVRVALGHAGSVGVDASIVSSQLLLMRVSAWQAIDPILWQMRRAKDPDELALMKVAIACTEAMYARAREMIEPGVSELEVFAELHRVAVKTAGEPLTALLGNDYASGVGGGPARKDKVAAAGQVYILDLGPAYRGYFADNARALSVDRKPTDAQMAACQAIAGVFPIVERMARPGVRCRDIYQAVNEHLQQARGKGLAHHLGHGVGLQPHEYPHLNMKWDDTLIEGEVFTAEPGIYGADLAGGIRIENNYLVTATGVESLMHHPIDLA